MRYRPEIDGIRALAVMPVMLFHAGFEFFSGGFIGVDVFFVISGYLITTILIEDLEKKRFNIAKFYERRARRILPALYVLLIFSALYGLYTSPYYSRDIFQSIFATTLFSENLLLFLELSSYFALGTDEKLLFHTWSLAVEEQFYLFFPIFLVLIWPSGKNRVLKAIVLITIISLLISEWGWREKPNANFYLVFTRAWELFSGSIAAFILQKRGLQKSNPLSLLGITAILFSIFFYDKTVPFPSVYTLVPVLGAVLLVLYAEQETIIAKVLSNKAFVSVGLISYSAYLWHQPLIVIFNREVKLFEFEGWSIDYARIVVICITLIVATLSYYFIERPFRYKTKSKTFTWLFSLLTASLLALSFIGHKSIGYENLKMERFAVHPSLYIDNYKSLKQLNSLKMVGQNENMPKILVIGDSLAGDFKKALSMKGLFVEHLNMHGTCFIGMLEDGNCDVTLQELKSKIAEFDYVFLATNYVVNKNLDSLIDFYSAIAEVADIYFVSSYFFEHASDFSYRFVTGREDYSKKSVFNSLSEDTHIINRDLFSHGNIKILDKYSYFCSNKKQECILYSDSGKPLRYDQLHLTKDGLIYFGDKLIESLCQISNKFCRYL